MASSKQLSSRAKFMAMIKNKATKKSSQSKNTAKGKTQMMSKVKSKGKAGY